MRFQLNIFFFFYFDKNNHDHFPIYAGPTFFTIEGLKSLSDKNLSLKISGISFDKTQEYYRLVEDVENFYGLNIFDSVPKHYLISAYELPKMLSEISTRGDCSFYNSTCFKNNVYFLESFQSFFGEINFNEKREFILYPSIYIFRNNSFILEDNLR